MSLPARTELTEHSNTSTASAFGREPGIQQVEGNRSRNSSSCFPRRAKIRACFDFLLVLIKVKAIVKMAW